MASSAAETPLCAKCRNLPLDDLPGFRSLPQASRHWKPEDYKEKFAQIPKKVFWHSLESLRLSADSCDLCKVVLTKFDEFQPPASLAEVHRTAGQMFLITGAGSRQQKGFSFHACEMDVGYFREVASFDISVPDDSPLSREIPGRPIQKATRREDVLRRAKQMVEECNEHSHSQIEIPHMPTRVLDVCSRSDPQEVALTITHGIHAPYVALSYRWSLTPVFTTTTSTLQEHTIIISVPSLPVTIQDAITLTQALGFRYLWVDSLCIVQDDALDWEVESQEMPSIYSSASLTLAAAGANDSSFSFFDCTYEKYISIPFNPKSEPQTEVLVSLRTEDASDLGWFMSIHQPLFQRGWTFQERLMSHRTLHFRKSCILFECTAGSRDERGYWSHERFPNVANMSMIVGINSRRIRREFCKTEWINLLPHFSKRRFTKLSDRLQALSGIAAKLASISGDNYIAGLWQSQIVDGCGLLWYVLDAERNSAPDVEAPDDPSWSWNAVACPVYLFETLSTPIAELIASNVVLKGTDQYGGIESASLTLSGPLLKVTFKEQVDTCMPVDCGQVVISYRIPTGDAFRFTMLDTFILDRREESDNTLERMQVFLFVDSRRKWAEKAFNCLVITPSTTKAGDSWLTFRRLGIFWSASPEIEKQLDKKVTITLV